MPLIEKAIGFANKYREYGEEGLFKFPSKIPEESQLMGWFKQGALSYHNTATALKTMMAISKEHLYDADFIPGEIRIKGKGLFVYGSDEQAGVLDSNNNVLRFFMTHYPQLMEKLRVIVNISYLKSRQGRVVKIRSFYRESDGTFLDLNQEFWRALREAKEYGPKWGGRATAGTSGKDTVLPNLSDPGAVRKLAECISKVVDRFDPAQSAINEGKVMRGGIDLSSFESGVQTQNAGGVIHFHLDPAMLAQIQKSPGFVPVIISIQPMADFKWFFTA